MRTDGDGIHHFRHDAMAAPFEIIIAGETAEYARQAADAAFLMIDRIEGELSRFKEHSDVSQINHLRPGEMIRIGYRTFGCLRIAAQVHADTGGAFDVTIGPLIEFWQKAESGGRPPKDKALAKVRARVGMDLLGLDENGFQVGVKKKGVQVDLGGIGKGYALDAAAEVLHDWSIEAALLSAGESTVLAIGAPPGAHGWTVAVGGFGVRAPEKISLCGRALSGSGIEVRGRHIFDPRTGKPAEGKVATWACAQSGAVADALSTAFMAMLPGEVERYCQEHPDTGAMLTMGHTGQEELLRFGNWPPRITDATQS